MAKASRAGRAVRFEQVCAELVRLLDGPCRARWCDELSAPGSVAAALAPLRASMCAHAWTDGRDRLQLRSFIGDYDARARADGFHALHDWDGVADEVNRFSIPIDVLDFIVRHRGVEPCDRATLAILIDYYFLYLLALASLRLWDDGDADANLGRLDALLAALQGPGGSGQRFVDDGATLILVATSHYEREERGFLPLLERARTLSAAQQLRIAIGHASAMGCHLRFGFEATYGRSVGAMRADNVADYPWLAFSLLTVLREYGRSGRRGAGDEGRLRLVEALANGLSADPTAFLGPSPAPEVWPADSDAREFAGLVAEHGAALATDAEALRPADGYSPLAFFFNFSQNVLKGMVIDSLLWSEPSALRLNDMLRGASGAAGAARLKMAATLERYARSRPHRIRGRLMPVIVYDPAAGRRALAGTLAALQDGSR